MINFSDVRWESTPAFVFFAQQLRTSLEYALKECQITGWQIMTRREVQPYLSEGFIIPEVRISPGAPRIEKSVRVFVSYFNQNDMLRKLEEIPNDQDTGSTTVNQDVVLMSERNVHGQSIMSSECNDGSAGPGWFTCDRTQFPLFLLAPEFIQKERNGYWLRDVVSASCFAAVNTNGIADCSNAIASSRVRPAFSIS